MYVATAQSGSQRARFLRTVVVFTCINLFLVTPTFAGLVISEFSYNPNQGADSSHEYFVLLNNMASPIDIDGYTFSDNGANSTTIIDSEFIVGPSQYVVVSELSQSAFEASFSVVVPSNAQFITASSNITFLNNTSDSVRLLDESDSLVYDAAYESSYGANGDGNVLVIDNVNFSTPVNSPAAFSVGSPLSSIAAIPEPTAFLFGTLIAGCFGFVKLRRRRDEAAEWPELIANYR